MRKLKVAVLGAAGSIGRQALDVIKGLSNVSVTLIATGKNKSALFAAKKEFEVSEAYLSSEETLFSGSESKFLPGYLGLSETYQQIDVVINGIAGMDGILPSIAVLEAGKILATANKESIVCFGTHLKALEQRFGGKILPVDSEHSALLQCMIGDIKPNKLYITASGGAFRDEPLSNLANAKATDALNHPNWKMGKKVTIDCATMVNKAFELIEAARLFETTEVSAILHRESIVHALAEFDDGSIKASLGFPDMRIPIQFALTYPNRVANPSPKLNIAQLGRLTFESIDENRYPAFSVLKHLVYQGEYEGTVAVAADEILVPVYLKGQIGYFDIAKILSKVIGHFKIGHIGNFSEVIGLQKEVYEYTREALRTEGK